MSSLRAVLAATIAASALAWTAAHATSPEVRQWRPGRGERQQVADLGVRIHGAGHVVVVLLSGLASSERLWGGAYDVLGRHARVVAIDPIGFGSSMESAALGREIDADAHVDAVIAVLTALDLHEVPAIIVGHSMGASLALRVAARHAPASTVVAFDAPLYHSSEEADERVRHMGWFESLLAQGPLAERVCEWMCHNRRVARALAVTISPRLPVAVASDTVHHTWRGYIAGFESLVRDLGWSHALRVLDERRVTVRLVDGDHDPVQVPGRADELASTYPLVTALRLPGDHRLPLSDPSGCASIVLAVLREDAGKRSRAVTSA